MNREQKSIVHSARDQASNYSELIDHYLIKTTLQSDRNTNIIDCTAEFVRRRTRMLENLHGTERFSTSALHIHLSMTTSACNVKK